MKRVSIVPIFPCNQWKAIGVILFYSSEVIILIKKNSTPSRVIKRYFFALRYGKKKTKAKCFKFTSKKIMNNNPSFPVFFVAMDSNVKILPMNPCMLNFGYNLKRFWETTLPHQGTQTESLSKEILNTLVSSQNLL